MAKTVPRLSPEQIKQVIAVAWDDRPPYHQVLMRCGLSPGQMLQLLRRELTPNAFKVWRARSQGPAAAPPKAPRGARAKPGR